MGWPVLMLVVLTMWHNAASAGRALQDSASKDLAGMEWHGSDQAFQDYGPGFDSQHSQWLHDWDSNDPQHRQFLQRIGRVMLEYNLVDSNSAIAVPVGMDSPDDTQATPGAAALAVSSASADAVSAGSAVALRQQNSSSNSPGPPVNSLVAAIEAKEVKINEAFRQPLAARGIHNVSGPMLRYYRVKSTRVMLLLADIFWLVFAAAGFAQRLFALLVPIVKIGQTGELKIDAVSFLKLAQLVADFVARLADLIGKAFLVLFRSINLANTLPPATG